MKKILPLFFAALLIQGCKTDLELNAPYKDITVVYGLLNSKDSLQFIKINKAFLGEGDALVFAQIPDSNEYRSEDIEYARVHRVEGGVRTATFQLNDTIIDRDPGPFYSPHTLYYFNDYVESVPLGDTVTYYYLRQNAEYELDLMVKGKHITAITNIVNDFTLGTSLLQQFQNFNIYNTQGYLNLNLAWNQAQDGKRYQLLCHTIYTEVLDGNSSLKRATLNLGSVVASADVAGQLSIPMNTEQYFSNLRNTIPEIAGVQRIFHGLEFEFIVANGEFNTALSLSEPVSGIIEDRPEYSNVNNGYGVFANRYNKKLLPWKQISGTSFDELKDGQYTANLNFDCYQYGNDGVMCP